MTPLHPDGAGHPQLAASLGRQHDEDQEDQQHAGEDGEDAEDAEDRGEHPAADAGRRDHRVLAQHIQHFQIADPAQDLSQPRAGLARQGQSAQPVLHVRLGHEHPQLRGDAGAAQFRDQAGRAFGQRHVVQPPAQESQEVGHVVFI